MRKLLMIAALAVATPSFAQGGARLADVQKAYADVDYEGTRALATAAVRRGGNDRASTSQLYLLWATAAAALDQADEARDAFRYALAADPELKLDRTLSPKIRAPYLEARGALSSTNGKPALELALTQRNQQLEVDLTDTLHVAASIVLATRTNERQSYARQRFDAVPTQRVPTPHVAELELALGVLDRYGNVLYELGTEANPRHLSLVSSARRAPADAPRGTDANPTPYYLTAGTLAVLGLGAGGAATALFLRREDAAREWNGPSCEHPGATRQEQCDSVDARRQRDQYLSLGFAATGGALLVGSIVTLVLAPSATHPNVTLDAALGNVMLRLRTTL